MNARTSLLIVFALLGAAAAAVFLAISIDRDVYAPGVGAFEGHLGVRGTLDAHFPMMREHDLSPERILRKIYSVGAFAIVAFFATPLFARGARVRAGAALLTGFSLAIEIAQRVVTHISHESNVSSLFDLACGAVGGALGALAWNLLIDRRPRTATDAS